MSDGGLRSRVKGLFGAPPAEGEIIDAAPVYPDSEAERQALQVLILAQRTADDHVASAQREADRIRSDAHIRAEELAKQAQANAEAVRREANQVLSDAQAKAKQISREAMSRADSVRQDAEKVLSDSQAKAQRVIEQAEASADELDRAAQQRYEEIVGTLESKQAALEDEIEALQKFDRDYRAKLAKFMVSQLRALGVDERAGQVSDEQPTAA